MTDTHPRIIIINMKQLGFSLFSDKNQLEKNTDNYDLVIQNCGYYIAQHESYDFNKFEDAYLILYQAAGTATIQYDQKSISLKAGSVYIFPQNNQVKIYYYNETKNERYYIYFCGSKVTYYFDQLKLKTNEPYNVGYFPQFVDTCHLLMEDFKNNGFENKTYKEILLLNVFASISKSQSDHLLSNSYKTIKAAIEHMKMHYKEEPLSNAEYARLCHISISTLINMFREYTGFTPKKYLMSIKIASAQDEIIHTNKTINEIAVELSFIDPLYFTRVFKKLTGLSPTDFRKKFLET